MAMTIAITRNAPGRFRGFFASCMLEVAPAIYVAPRMKKPVRERVWQTVLDWSEFLPADGGIILLWKSRQATSGLGMRLVGWPQKELIDHEGIWLATRALTAAHDQDELAKLAETRDTDRQAATADAADLPLSRHLPHLDD
ncbi:MAG: type I-E CRISPR-associated endoribonuclease Cas2e [Persicimonas sp.]